MGNREAGGEVARGAWGRGGEVGRGMGGLWAGEAPAPRPLARRRGGGGGGPAAAAVMVGTDSGADHRRR